MTSTFERLESCTGKLYTEAIKLYAQDPQALSAHDMVLRGVEVQLKLQQWDEAAMTLMLWASVCLQQGAYPHLCRAYLGVRLYWLQCC